MGIYKYLIIVGVLVAAPSFAYAAGTVRINEIAWMGTKASAYAEWIELFNNSNVKIQLNGWELTSSDGSPDIHFSNKDTISPKGYFLLERKNHDAVPKVKADKTYTGSLKNSGETLTLTNMASTTEDIVVGGKNWCAIGGDNSTKQTAQRTNGGWVTATGTPRAVNATAGVPASCTKGSSSTTGTKTQATSGDATATSTATSATTATSTVVHHYGKPEFELVPPVFISIGNNMNNIVAGADVRFSAVVTDKTGKQYKSAVVHWAFGDGSKATGMSVFKNYRAPGTYAVVANAVQGLGSGEASLIATVRDAHVSIPSISKRGITVKNDTQYPLDMSLWRLHAGTTTFAFPQHTIILPSTSVLFPADITKLSVTNDAELLYPNGKEVAKYISGNNADPVRTQNTEKLSSISARYNNVQGSENKNTYPLAQQNIIHSHNATSAYDTKAPIAPAVSTKIATAGAPVAAVFNATSATTTSFTYRFLYSTGTLPLLLVLILSMVSFILL